MSSFEYVVSNAGFGNPSGEDKNRQFVSLLGSDRESASGTTVLSGSLPESSYPPFTGVGFEPDLVLLTSQVMFGGGGGQQVVTMGAAARGKQFGMKFDLPSYLGGRFFGGILSWHQTDQIIPEIAEFSSFDADGFTLNVANPLGYDLPLGYFAARGGGAYDIGTFQYPGASGDQSITGLGFQPEAVMFFSAHQPSLGSWTGGGLCSIGAGDDLGHGYSAAFLHSNGDIYDNSLDRQKAALLGLDADGNLCFAGFDHCSPHVQAEATLTMDPDGFTLHWARNEGGSMWLSYIAFENAEVGRFVYNHTSADYFAGTHFVVPLTKGAPKGLIFYMNDLGHDLTTQNTPSTEGATLALGFCGADLSGQNFLTFNNVSRGIGGPGLPAPDARLVTDHGAFGCLNRAIGGFDLEDIDDGQIVTLVGAEARIVGMNWRSSSRRGTRGRMLGELAPNT